MARFLSLVVWGTLTALSLAEVFTLSLGDIGKYSTSLTATPTLTGSRVLFTEPANPNDGVDIVLSDELRANIDKAIADSCKNVDSQCVESIKNLLVNPHTELEARQLVAAGAGLFALLALAIPLYEKERSQGVPVAIHIPSAQIDPAASAAQASTIAAITGSGSPLITITQKPDLASVTATKRFRERALGDQYVAMACASEQIALNSSPGGAFAELIELQGPQPAWTSPELMQALGGATTWAVAKAPTMKYSSAEAKQIISVGFMLSFIVIILKQPLSGVNWISGSELRGSMTLSPMPTTISVIPTSLVTTSTVMSTSSVFECVASCKMIGHIKSCNTKCPTATGAPIPKPTNYAVKTATIERWVVPYLPQTPLQAPVGLCIAAEDTNYPIDLFAKTYSDFCDQADQSTSDISWTVNAQGQQIARKLRRFVPRGGAADVDEYKDYSFTLWWRPVAGGSGCAESCNDAFEQLVTSDSCKQGSNKSNMASRGSIDLGCGAYSFAINSKPAAESPKSSTKCRNHPLSAPKHDANANGATSVDAAAQRWCSDNDGHALTGETGKNEVYFRWGITQLSVPNRSSFWLRASLNGDNKQGKVIKSECIAALTDSLAQCDVDKDVTHGFTASVGSIDYSLDLSGVTVDGNPPWNEKPAFPAPEFTPGKDLGGAAQSPTCYPSDAELGRKVSGVDLESAMNAFCVNGADIAGFGYHWDKMFQYPPKGQPQFYNSASTKMHLEFGAETINNGAKEPYNDMSWCK
ncbi:hypothetical protein N0V83_009614 [Neocucurbitaria cava]|uniref:Uncharacterized protein n=1 Tax=Neocucurbitaria cava TaxID=798079 RepID=A0A9W9CIL8_9PLEO|nr:hypothetical protein N0V83_009614 [Neocucurbitaria cava]